MHLLSIVAAVLAVGTSVNGKDLGEHQTGHYASGMTKEIATCEHTFQVTSKATCQEIAEATAMTLAAFTALNPKICTGPLSPLTIVCISSEVFQDETGNAFNGTLAHSGATLSVLPHPGAANRPDFNGTFPTRKSTTTTASGTETALPTDPAASPSPVPPPPPPPCYDGTLNPCVGYSQSDNPPNWRGADVVSECGGLTNYARQHYNPGTWDLQWDATLAAYAYDSAVYAATYQCNECHTNSGPGTTWGQNLFLGPCSCSDAYNGWVTNEAAGNDPYNRDEGHFTNIVGFFVPYQSVGCGSAEVNGVCATLLQTSESNTIHIQMQLTQFLSIFAVIATVYAQTPTLANSDAIAAAAVQGALAAAQGIDASLGATGVNAAAIAQAATQGAAAAAQGIPGQSGAQGQGPVIAGQLPNQQVTGNAAAIAQAAAQGAAAAAQGIQGTGQVQGQAPIAGQAPSGNAAAIAQAATQGAAAAAQGIQNNGIVQVQAPLPATADPNGNIAAIAQAAAQGATIVGQGQIQVTPAIPGQVPVSQDASASFRPQRR
ncbi:UNVERIFIED_CONTAM: hypothetical protein HDU68_002824 [Siphonaria sp. JEL0065]|nr:hypothetical protein HDU68_002824 [Siphonaria sp. JEL0065]